MSNGVFTTGIPLLSKQMCRRLVKASQEWLINVLEGHIDTLSQAVARQVLHHPPELQKRIEGYKKIISANKRWDTPSNVGAGFIPARLYPNGFSRQQKILEAGFPPDRVFNCVTRTAPSAETFEETFDWRIDTMGARFMEVMVFVRSPRPRFRYRPRLRFARAIDMDTG